MKKLILMSLITLGILSTTSCASHRESTRNQNQIQTSVVLNKKNYRIVKTVTGESSQIYLFGLFGGITTNSLNESAMSDMMKNANLEGSQAIINTNIQYKDQFMVIFTRRKAIATGTIIEFTE